MAMVVPKDSTKTKEAKKKHDFKNDTLNSVFRPTIGFEVGVMSFFGDIQNNLKGYGPLTGSYGFRLYASAPLNNALSFEVFGQFNKITANERTPTRNLNFQSRIKMGGVMLYYNLFPLVGENLKKYFNPIIGIGVSSFEFNSKSDISNSSATYNYWSDGSIRNLAENDPNAINAVLLKRDNNYDTDLRELDLDGFGLYKIQSWSIPISVGVEFRMGKRFAARLSTTYHFTFTDLIDNVSYKGTGIRKGNKQFDNLLWTSIGVSYDLVFKKKGAGIKSDDDYLIDDPHLADSTDTDLDGIMDPYDKCAYTPLEASIDEFGCPLDEDGDLIPDYIDEEPGTPDSNEVNMYGVTIPTEVLNNRIVIFFDTTDRFVFYDYVEQQFFVPGYPRGGRKPQPKSEEKTYIVILDKEASTDSSAIIHQYIGYENFESIEKGDTTYYGIGGYDTAEDAIAAKKDLEDKGIKVVTIGSTRETSNSMILLSADQINNVASNSENEIESKQGKIYRIQIGAFKKKVDDGRFDNLNNVVYAKGKDGYTRYYAGSFETSEEANKYKVELVTTGFANAFVVAYEKGERLTLAESGADVSESYNEKDEINKFVEPRNENEKVISFKVFLGEFDGALQTDMVELYLEIGGIQNEDKGTTVAYYSKNYSTLEAAQKALEDIKSKGIDAAALVGDEDGATITVQEAIEKSKK